MAKAERPQRPLNRAPAVKMASSAAVQPTAEADICKIFLYLGYFLELMLNYLEFLAVIYGQKAVKNTLISTKVVY